MESGYFTFEDIECVFFLEKLKMSIKAVTIEGSWELKRRYIHNMSFGYYKNFIEFKTDRWHSRGKIKKVSSSNSFDIVFNFSYIVQTLKSTNKISEMVFTGDEITHIFNPSRYFYINREQTGIGVYDSFVAFNYCFNYKNKDIKVEVTYGDLLQRGIASDLRVKPKLHLKFEETSDVEFLHGLYNTTTRFLQIVMHQERVNFSDIQLYSLNGEKKSYIGNFVVTKYDYRKYLSDISYEVLGSSLKKLLQFSAENINLNFDCFPRFCDDNVVERKRIIKLFSFFETEFKLNSIYEIPQNEIEDIVKIKLLKQLDEFQQEYMENIGKDYFKNFKSQIQNYGKNVGQRRKIHMVFENLRPCLESSLDSISVFDEFDINNISKKIVKLRNLVAHENPIELKLSREDKSALLLMEVMSYSMLLNRAKVNFEAIEMIVGVHFHTNLRYLEETVYSQIKSNE